MCVSVPNPNNDEETAEAARQKEVDLSFIQPEREKPAQAILEEACAEDKDKDKP